MAELSLDNILTDIEIDSLFTEETQETQPNKNEDTPDNKDKTTEVNPDTLFDQEQPEIVGSEDKQDKEDTDSDKGSTSPNFYSSIAKALTEEGIFPDLDDDAISKITTPEDFRDAIEQRIKSELDERQKRIDDALNANVEISEVKKYEQTISYLDSLKDTDLEDESENGENLRKNLIYQDFINRGYSKERATKEVQKSLKGGTDIDDAKEALASNKEYFQQQYSDLIKEAQDQEKEFQKERKKQAEALKNSILSDKKVFGDIELDKNTRQRIFDNISKPIYKDPESGEYMTAIQKYEMENKTDFLKYVGILYTMTDGFKDIDNLVKGKVRKEVKKGIRELENTLNNTVRTSDGNLKLATGGTDQESWFKNYTIDI